MRVSEKFNAMYYQLFRQALTPQNNVLVTCGLVGGPTHTAFTIPK